MPDTQEKLETQPTVERKRPAYDPNNLSPGDAESRKYDDTSDGIDWDEIIATTQDDYLAGRFAYNSADYATQEEADAALRAWFDAVVERSMRDVEPIPACDGEGRAGY